MVFRIDVRRERQGKDGEQRAKRDCEGVDSHGSLPGLVVTSNYVKSNAANAISM
jgi:hypothetical protein